MRMSVALFVSITLVSLSMTPGFAHLLEMPAKLRLNRDAYFLVQQIYRGWALIGLVMFPTLASTVTLAAIARRERRVFYFSAVAACCVALSLVVFFAFTFPVNQITINWTVVRDDWTTLRRQWEYSHAAGAVLYFIALLSLTAAALTRRAQVSVDRHPDGRPA